MQIYKRKVYVPNKGQHDYTKAWAFGDLVFCTDGTLNRRDIATMHGEITRTMIDADEDDIILITSLSSICSIAAGIMAARFGKLNLLLYEDGEYIERSVDFDN